MITALGIGVFFALPVVPPAQAGPIVALFAAAGWLMFKVRILRWSMVTVLCAALGFAAAELRTQFVEAPVLPKEIGPVWVEGRVISAEPVARGYRLTLDELIVQDLSPGGTPERVRITVPRGHDAPSVGDGIEVRAVVRPPGRPVMPGGFDFQRYSFYRQLGGIGFSVGRWSLKEPSQHDQLTLQDRIRSLRAEVGERLTRQMPDEAGSVARALVTGERSAIAEPLQEAYRQSGLAHMLAISGLHMSLLAGLAFVAARRSIALVPLIAERFDTKKIAAVAALGAAFCYLLLSGMNVPAQRAFVMVTVVFVAVLLDRTAVSLRTLALAAMLVLISRPEALVGASFQLSFAAVILLITIYERVQILPHLRNPYGDIRPLRALLLYAAAVLVTDLIATTATAPFTGFHFHEIPKYSLLANLLAVSIMGLWIMPFAMLFLILMPIGLEGVALAPMAFGIETVNTIARFVSSLPGSTLFVPQAPWWAITCIALGGIFTCLWKGRLRWAGLVLMAFALPQPWLSQMPDMLIDESAKVYAVKGQDGRLVLMPGRGDRFTRSVWTEAWGLSVNKWANKESLKCDLSGCILRAEYGSAALAFDEVSILEDCGRQDVMVATIPIGDL